MSIEWIRERCLGLPHVTEDVKWETNLVFAVAARMFAIAALEPGETWASFKCSPEDFAELVERPGVRPAPYLARAQWVALDSPDALPRRELQLQLERAYQIVFAKLSKKRRMELGG